ncbi:MAG: acyl-CoA synthetase [Marmoricola sp.]|nr:acyl-CoA synthetase [Marmoricola sp.]
MTSPAVVTENGQVLAHDVVADRVARVASVLCQPGMAPGDVVALLSESSAAALEILWAARRAGLVLLPVDPSLSLDEIAYVLNDSGARVLVVSARYAELAASLPPLTPYVAARFSIDAVIDGHRALSLARSTAPPAPDSPPARGTVHYTASVTGRPTAFGVPDAASDELAAILGGSVASGLGPESVLVTVCPVSDPVSSQLVAAVYAAGGTVVTLLRATPDRLLQAIAQNRATIVHLSPGGAIRLAKLPRQVWDRVAADTVHVAVLSAPSCPRHVLVALNRGWGPVVRQLFVSPGSGVVAALDSEGLVDRPGSVGRDPRGLVEIVDDVGEPQPPDVVGWVRTRREGANRPSRERGHLDADGYLYLVDVEAFAGEAGGLVVPREIENVLVTHPLVAGAAVVWVSELGVARDLLAFVEVADPLRPSITLEEELVEYLRMRIPEAWLPRRISITAKLPRTASGKLDKRRLAPRSGLTEGSLT